MKAAISNIAWRAEEDRSIAELLARLGFSGLEVAPTRVWKNPLAATSAEIAAQRRFWESHGLPIVAMQSLLFGHPELTLFESAEMRAKTFTYLSSMISLGRDLGAHVVVFGSPKNRKTNGRSASDIQTIALDFFRALGNRAGEAGVCFCIEPNPSNYECDFITTSHAGAELVRAVNTSGFGLHLDAAAMTLAEENPDTAVPLVAPLIRHFHVSEKDLAPIGSGSVDHARFAAALRRQKYAQWVSIEMRPDLGDNRSPIQRAWDQLASIYGD